MITYCHFCGNRLITKFVEGNHRFFCNACRTPIYQNPVPANCVVVINGENELLLVKRSVEPKVGFWCLPGGFMELNEHPEASALRELKEETGLEGHSANLLGVTASPSSRYDTILMIGYLVKTFSGNLIAGDDASDVGWFDLKDLPEIAFDSHLKFVNQYMHCS
jgi:ADP-ribose pyrophosphatase YjhB (NUDIX family)